MEAKAAKGTKAEEAKAEATVVVLEAAGEVGANLAVRLVTAVVKAGGKVKELKGVVKEVAMTGRVVVVREVVAAVTKVVVGTMEVAVTEKVVVVMAAAVVAGKAVVGVEEEGKR